jgi:hypothetical protein
VLRRKAPDAADFVLSEVPTGRTALDAKALAPSPMAFGNLTALDVAPAATVDFSASDTATLSLSDGNVLTLRGSAVGEKRWLTVESSKDAALSAKTRGHAYALAAYRYDAIFRPLEQLLQPKSAPARQASSPPKGGRTRPPPPPPGEHTRPPQPPP